jgi:maleylpyruvate isomerase
LKLYSYWRSTSSWRVRIALLWKGVAFEYAPVHLLRGGGEQWSPEHRARSPMGKIPVLELDDGRHISESMAILAYLEETHPDPPLLPGDPYLRARARMIAEMVNSGIQPLQNLEVIRHVKDVLGRDEKAWAANWNARGVAALEAAVGETAGRFCVGDEPSIADVYLVPQLYGARRVGVNLEAMPTLLRIETACCELPAFAASHPDRQPDAAS